VEKNKPPFISQEDVAAYLMQHPDFFSSHAELLASLHIPARNYGENVLDFQHFAIDSLKKKINSHDQDKQHILDTSRAAKKTERMVRESVLALLATHSLDDFLQCLCQEIVTIFDVDVVRLAIESELNGGIAESYYPEEYYSGLVLLPIHYCETIFTKGHSLLTIPDSDCFSPELLRFFFHECLSLARSSLMLLLPLPRAGRYGALALGSRHTGRFQAGQGGTEMLHFFAETVSLLLDRLLYEHAGTL
jgi:uncharacterized protein